MSDAGGAPEVHRGPPAAGIAVISHPEAVAPPRRAYPAWTRNRVAMLGAPLGGLAAIIANFSASQWADEVALIVFVFALTFAVIWLAVWRGNVREQRRFHAAHPLGDAWLSGLGLFLGPFDEQTGVRGANGYGTAENRDRGRVPTHLVLTRAGIDFEAPRPDALSLTCPFDTLRSIEIFPPAHGTLPRLLTPGSAWKRGRVVITTTDDRTATFAGATLAPLANLLAAIGADLLPH